MIGVLRAVLFMACWAITSAVLVVIGLPVAAAIIVGLVLTVFGVMLIDLDVHDWF